MKAEPREGYLRSGGYRLHYLLWGGSGPKLVLLHSMGMDAHGFDQFSDALQGRYQLLAFDILDHGDSEKPKEAVSLVDHAEIMRDGYRQLGFFPNVLIGHSVGGMMGMILAARHPDELRGLVLVDIAPFELAGRPTRPPPPEFFADEEEARIYFRRRYPGFTAEAVENRMKHALVEDGKGRLRLKATGDAIRPSLGIDLWPYVDRIEAPTLLLLGSESDLVTEETLERMKRTMPSLKVVTVEGATHMIPQDRPAEFEEHVRAFLESLG
ncbi:MAG: alpha/beta fold hydrolase [Candidatus Bathyarchaeia archaeon]